MTIALAYLTSREWLAATAARGGQGRVRGAAVAATAAVFGQLVLGAIMRHIGAGLAVPDFPACTDGGSRPRKSSSRPRWPFILAHRPGLSSSSPSSSAWPARLRDHDLRLARPPRSRSGSCSCRSAWARSPFLTGKAVLPTTAHVATGAAILGLCWFTTLRTRRHLRAAAPAPAVAALGDPAVS
jgi:heme A synthase